MDGIFRQPGRKFKVDELVELYDSHALKGKPLPELGTSLAHPPVSGTAMALDCTPCMYST